MARRCKKVATLKIVHQITTREPAGFPELGQRHNFTRVFRHSNLNRRETNRTGERTEKGE